MGRVIGRKWPLMSEFTTMSGRVFDPATALDELGRCELGHRARTKRLVQTARLLAAEGAGRSLPDRLSDRSDYDGALNLVNNPAVQHPFVLQPHTAGTRQRMLDCPGVVLNISDTTELDYTGLKVANLGPIGNGGGRGFECHNSLALDPVTGNLLGLTSQILHVRGTDEQVRAQRQARGGTARPARKKGVAGRRPDEPVAQRRARASRESRLWVTGCEALGEVPEGKLWVDVCDRAADTFEFLQFMTRRRRHYVIRSKHNRTLEEPNAPPLEVLDEGSGPRLLHERLRSRPGVLSWSVEIAANRGQLARAAAVSLSWVPVCLAAPQPHKGEYDDEPVAAWAIRVWEPNPPAGVEEPLEWFLLTNVAVRSDDEARERVSWYECRPVIEEFHKAQKTGMAIEQLQLQTRGGLEPLIGLLSILAVTLVNWRQLARQPEAATAPARQFVSAHWVRVLCTRLYREQRELTLRQFMFGVAQLGGYMNRRKDAWPGWIVLWRGLTKLLHMVEYDLARGDGQENTPEL
jgi:hypothetical protein